MAESKYGKYVLSSDIYHKMHFTDGIMLDAKRLGADLIMGCHVIDRPYLMVKDAHSHDFHQVLCFVGSNLEDLHDFGGGVVELSLGEEGEKQVITSTSVVTIPPGLKHCPLNFVKVEKPIIFVEIMLTAGYVRK